MKINKKLIKIVSINLLTLVFIFSNIFASFVIVSGEQVTVNEVINMIDQLPNTYSGLPLVNGEIDEITYSTNALPFIKDTSVAFEGINPIKITSESGGSDETTFGKTFASSQDLSDLDNIEMLLWFYEQNPELYLSSFRIDLVTSAGNYFYKYVDGSYWKRCPGASRIRYNISEFKIYGNPDLSNINSFNLRIKGVDYMVESLGLFSVTYNARSTPKVILTFDDGWQDNYDNAFPILEAQGFKGVSYAVSDFVQGNDPNYMRKPTLDILYNAGWDISNHSKHHENYKITPGANAEYMGTSYKTCLDFLLDCGYERSARYVCYPDGSFDDELIPYLKDIGIVSARTTRIGYNAEPYTDLYKLKQYTIGAVTTFGVDNSSNDIKACIDRAIASGQTMSVMMHRVSLDNQMNISGDSTNSIKTSVTMLTQVVQYLKDTGVKVCTMSEWYDELPSIKTLTLFDKYDVYNAKTAYDQLYSEQKALVTNYKNLTDAIIKIEQLQGEALQQVIDEIFALPLVENLTLTDKSAIIKTRQYYELLTQQQKELVTNYSILVDAEQAIYYLEINTIIEKIDFLPSVENLVLSDKTRIASIRENYNNLTTEQKLLVTNYDKLTSLEAKILILEDNAVFEIIDLIYALPDIQYLVLEDRAFVEEARAKYNILDDILKVRISNYETLQKAELSIDNLLAEQVVDKINALPINNSGITLINGKLDDITYSTNTSQIIKDTSVSFEGAYPIKITSESGSNITPTTFGKTFEFSKDLSDLTNIEMLLWFYEQNPELYLSSFRIDLVTSAGNYFYKYVDGSYWKRCPGASRIRYNISEFLTVGSPDLSNINSFNIRIKGAEGMIESLGIFSIDYNASSSPKVILTFDDGWQDNYDNAFPILEAQGFKGVSYAVSDFVQGNDPNYMRKPTLDILYNAGWDISNHSKHHENYKITPGANAEYMGTSYKTCLDFLLDCGYERSARFLSYTDSNSDDELIPYLKDMGIVSARTTRIGYNTEPPVDLYKLKQITIGADTTFGVDNSSNDIKACIDLAIASGQTMAIMMHRVSLDSQMNAPDDSSNSIKTSVTMLTQVAQYLKDIGVEVCTMSDWYNELETTEKLTLANKTEVSDARASYNQLSQSQKEFVTNYKTLLVAETILSQLSNEALPKVIDEISALPSLENLKIEHKFAIEKARQDYEFLPSEQKPLVTNYSKLLGIESKFEQLNNAVNIIIGYADNNNANSLTISQLSAVGVTKAYEENLAEYKTEIENSTEISVNTISKIQAIIDTVNTPIITINSYITTQTNQNIIVTASTSKGILNSYSYTFTKNGSFEFIATYKNEYIVKKTVTITNIIIKGDVTGDGIVNALDLLQLKKHLLGQVSITGSKALAADVTGDGKINALDLLKLKKYLLGQVQL